MFGLGTILRGVGWMAGTRAGRITAAVLAALVVVGVYTYWQRQDAAQRAAQELRDRNEKAISKGKDRGAGYLECVADGGLFNFRTGDCSRDQ